MSKLTNETEYRHGYKDGYYEAINHFRKLIEIEAIPEDGDGLPDTVDLVMRRLTTFCMDDLNDWQTEQDTRMDRPSPY